MCELLWVIDTRVPGTSLIAQVLQRVGQVVDIAECTDQQLVQRAYDAGTKGVVSYLDPDLHRQAWLAEALDLPTSSVRATALLTDKLLQREALAVAGVAQPRFSAVREPVDDHEVDRLCGELDFPLLFKPRDGMACRGISAVHDEEELRRLLRATERPAEMLLEELMPDCAPTGAPYAGRVTVESVESRGVTSHYAIIGLFSMVPPFRSSGGFFPADVPPDEAQEILALATGAIKALGSGFGCYRTEVKLTPDGPKVIEVNGRPTGLTPATVELAAGFDVMAMSMRIALGEHIVLEGQLVNQGVAYRYYGEPPMSAERVLTIEGLEKLQDLGGVTSVEVHKAAGDPVDWRNGSLDRIFQVTGLVGDYAELARHHRAFAEDVIITYQDRSFSP
ncbi:MAG TPA: ATP-grasp domain-containing protein [Acidimicrobiales bacterium]|nr:ATP-grasp domain-containing protein [Acidimicrobiales bacterium]